MEVILKSATMFAVLMTRILKGLARIKSIAKLKQSEISSHYTTSKI